MSTFKNVCLVQPARTRMQGGSPGVHSWILVLHVQWVRRTGRERKMLPSLRSLGVGRAPRPLGGGGTGRSHSGH